MMFFVSTNINVAKPVMVKSRICIHVGQCGNQIAQNFWHSLLQEHADISEDGKHGKFRYDGALCSMLTNLDRGGQLRMGSDVKRLRARAILVDMEERVLDHTKRSVIGALFDSSQRLSDCSGSGNNWAYAFSVYGSRHGECIADMIQSEMEKCDVCDSFLMFQSTGGGTGSGLGSFILRSLSDIAPKTTRVVTGVIPSGGDDVVTSPYNTVLSLRYFKEFADMVIPVDNTALGNLAPPYITRLNSSFDPMNYWVSKLWLDLLAPVRYDSEISQSLSSIARDLGLYQDANYAIPSVAPSKPPSSDLQAHSKSFDLMFSDIFKKQNCLLSVDLRKGKIIGSHKVVRCKSETISDILRNTRRNRSKDPFLYDSLSVAKAAGHSSIASLVNSSSMVPVLNGLIDKFKTLFKRKANLHHYLAHISRSDLEEALESVESQRKHLSSLS